jgi:hypothetical protein
MEPISVVVGGKTVIFDAEDLPLFQAHKWRINPAGYLRRHGDRRNSEVSFHREVLKAPSFSEVDHANGDPLDNRKCNLRFCHRAQNMQNCRPVAATSKYKGVGLRGGSWRARIRVGSKHCDLLGFKTETEAAQVYDYLATRLFREFARLNKPDAPPLPPEMMAHLDRCLTRFRQRNAA